MPAANMVEIETALRGSIAWCQAHASHRLGAIYGPQLEKAQRRLQDSIGTTDTHYLRWQTEMRQERTAWKHAANLVREIQRSLRRVGAIDYPDERVMYWDHVVFEPHALALLDYLDAHRDVVDSAAEQHDRLTRALETAHAEDDQAEDALKQYKRFIGFRRDALSTAIAVIGEFRAALRRDLGKAHPQYAAISWPYAVSPDEGILF